MKYTLLFLALVSASCATTRFPEPARSNVYVSCLMSGLTATQCDCVDSTVAKSFDVSKPVNEWSEELSNEVFKALNDTALVCQKQYPFPAE